MPPSGGAHEVAALQQGLESRIGSERIPFRVDGQEHQVDPSAIVAPDAASWSRP